MVSHIDIAHFVLGKYLKLGDCVVDATCGGGNDSLFLAQSVLEGKKGCLVCIDIQKAAIEKTRTRLAKAGFHEGSQLSFYQMSHASFPSIPLPVSAFVYNLGYFPGGDPSITTLAHSTYASLKAALALLKPGGVIAITFYPGHPQGKNELDDLSLFIPFLEENTIAVFSYKQLLAPLSPQFYLLKKPFQKKE